MNNDNCSTMLEEVMFRAAEISARGRVKVHLEYDGFHNRISLSVMLDDPELELKVPSYSLYLDDDVCEAMLANMLDKLEEDKLALAILQNEIRHRNRWDDAKKPH